MSGMVGALVRWRTFVKGVRHKVPIGLAVLAVGVAMFLLVHGRFVDLASGVVAGCGLGIVIVGLGDE